MDYSLSNALKYRSDGIRAALVMYNVICQYGVHLQTRMARSPYLNIPDGLTIWKSIGLFHVHGHQKECELRSSPSLMNRVGEVNGEIVETMWASLNKVSGSTRTMSNSHRQEVLDRHMNDWNYKKMITMGEYCDL